MTRLASLLALSLLLAGGPAPVRAQAADPSAEIDKLMAPWSRPDRPGCAVSVIQGGKSLHARGYGAANVEAGIANTPDTAFHIASLSKQFTAFAVLLLQGEGKLSLQDDVRKYVPELHRFARPITLAQLLHHSSGLRDQLSLFWLQGRRGEDSVTQQDALRVIFGQRELNFAPGTAFGYSNSNYTLLALVVERVSGRSFADFLAERVFRPLGMDHSYVVDDYHRIRAGQAMPYAAGEKEGAPGDKLPERRFLPYASYGSTDIRSTAADLARWAGNFHDPKVGGRAIIDAMLKADPVTGYGGGLYIGTHRGLAIAGHSGIDPGFVGHFLVVPAQGLSVSLVCNIETEDPVFLARRIADLYLGGPFTDPPRPEVKLAPAELRRVAGNYRDPLGVGFLIEAREGKLWMQGFAPMVAHGAGAFSVKDAPVAIRFSGEVPARTLTIDGPGGAQVATRYVKRRAVALTPAGMADYLGTYYSPELATLVTVARRKDALWIIGPGWEARISQPPEKYREHDIFDTDSVTGTVRFRRDARGRVVALTSTNGRIVNLRFLRVTGLPQLGALGG
ncbi:serine hydrolase domain-containing protein [Sphingomonas sp. NIBR02145]|uniref:serine hydrolase domain-containing protein n=1 Tax=Sphingomonas sp. NIBR02145 TaxID=3014784 RepID=UPI0022B4243A|nr:serine hydrolase domain-containing protein [Sphingomonas sp. NIBR02145]WHU01204.1 serine hydrolase domain-containing protein [Sphingomonas sp. NIBR02145]